MAKQKHSRRQQKGMQAAAQAAQAAPPTKYRQTASSARDRDDISVDLPGLSGAFAKIKPDVWIMVALLLVPIFLAVFFRAYPAHLPITDDWAASSIDGQLMAQQSDVIRQQFPYLPQANIEAMARERVEEFKAQNKEALAQKESSLSAEFRSRMQNAVGETYLLAIDPYVWYMDAYNIVKNGHSGETIRDGVPFEERVMAPIGSPAVAHPNSYVMIWTWKVFKLFKPGLSLMGGAFWVPVIIAALSVIPAFFIVRRKAGQIGGFIAACLVATHTAFLGRTPGGFADTDAYNVFFPLLVAWLFLEAFETEELKRKIALAAGSGIVLGIYSKFWTGYWYILDILIGVIVAYVAFQAIRYGYLRSRGSKKVAFMDSQEWTSIKGALIPGGTFIVVAGVLVSLLLGIQAFLSLPMAVMSFSQLKVAARPDLWPNVLTTVAELNEVDFAGVVNSMGGRFPFIMALLGIATALLPFKAKLKGKDFGYIGLSILMVAYLVSPGALSGNFLYKLLVGFGMAGTGTLSAMTYLFLLCMPLLVGLFFLLDDDRQIDIRYALLLQLWFLGAMYATTKGIRFTLVLVPTFAIAIGTLAGVLYKHLKDYLAGELDIPSAVVKTTLAAVLVVVFLFAPVKNAHAVALHEVPSMNDAWYQSLEQIRDQTPPDTIITSWWDFGHWFKAIAERPVTFDGGTQNTPMAHWVGKLLLTTDEDESIGILRMLDCGSYTGFDAINAEMKDSLKTKLLLDAMILEDRAGAKELLADAGITGQSAENILNKTHCEPPAAVLITSSDMIGKAGVWGHFGAWSFPRAYIYNTLREEPQAQAVAEMQELFGHDEEIAAKLYYEANSLLSQRAVNNWISPWPGYIGDWIGCQMQNVSVNVSAMAGNAGASGGADGNADDGMENRTLAICPTNIRVGIQDNTDVVIELIIIDPERPEESRVRYGFYRGGQRVGANDGGKAEVLFFAHADAADGIERFDADGPSSGIGFMYDEQKARVLAVDPLLAGSMFTQLYYLDGKYNKHYAKFSDRQSFNNQRIAIWWVDWEGRS